VGSDLSLFLKRWKSYKKIRLKKRKLLSFITFMLLRKNTLNRNVLSNHNCFIYCQFDHLVQNHWFVLKTWQFLTLATQKVNISANKTTQPFPPSFWKEKNKIQHWVCQDKCRNSWQSLVISLSFSPTYTLFLNDTKTFSSNFNSKIEGPKSIW